MGERKNPGDDMVGYKRKRNVVVQKTGRIFRKQMDNPVIWKNFRAHLLKIGVVNGKGI